LKVVVTGASGFIGSHVIATLQCVEGIDVVATGRDEEALRDLGVEWVATDLYESGGKSHQRLAQADLLIHLAWADVTDVSNPVHTTTHLPNNAEFLVDMARRGVQRICCVGSCFEYGLSSGCLSEESTPQPVTPYGQAKDQLRRQIEPTLVAVGSSLRWLRPFFTHGKGQHPHALFAQLNHAIETGQARFPMSGGAQVRDYLPVSVLAEAIVKASLQTEIDGIINICSGKPRTVRAMVEQHIASSGSSIEPELGRFPYPTHTPMEFWGDSTKLTASMAAFDRGFSMRPRAESRVV
jgi:nucleoside-diphosphate-sugar epimerase